MPLQLLHRPHVPLLALLVAMLTVFPLIERSQLGRCLLNATVVAGVISSLRRVHAAPRALFAIAVFGAVAVGSQILHEAELPGEFAFVSALSQTVFFAGTALLMCVYMLGDTRATLDELFAAAAAFMLIALAWSNAYWCIEHVQPGAFVMAHPTVPDRKTWFEFLYVSMATLSTTGFGDIVPVSTAARASVILEQFVGVLYVALVISRLAGFENRRDD